MSSIAAVRSAPVGSFVTVSGVVTSSPGRLGKPPLVAIEDGSAAIVVHLPDGAAPGVGRRVRVSGKTAAPYGQLEIRPDSGRLVDLGRADPVSPLSVEATDLGEALEARLVSIVGTVSSSPKRATSGDLSIDVTDDSGHPFRLMVDASARVDRTAFAKGARYRIRGIVGQRSSRLGVLDGYRIWLGGANDLVRLGGSNPSPGPSGEPGSVTEPGCVSEPDPDLGSDREPIASRPDDRWRPSRG